VRLDRRGPASAFLSFSTIRTLRCPPIGSLPKQQARGNVDAQWCRLSIQDERWPPLFDPLHQGGFSGVLRENFHAGPARSMMGPRIKTISSGSLFSFVGPLTTSLAICRRSHFEARSCPAVSRNLAWDSALSVARSIAPAHVPKIAPPCFANFAIASARPSSWRNCNCVVLSPRAESTRHNLRVDPACAPLAVSAPSRASIAACASKSPCTARIPIFTSFTPHSLCARPNLLPAARRQHVLLFHLTNVQSAHGFAQLFVSFEHHVGILEVGRCFHYGLRPHLGSLDLKMPDPTNTASAPRAPHQRCVCRSGNAARGKIRHRQLAGFGDLAKPVREARSALWLRRINSSSRWWSAFHLADDRAHVPTASTTFPTRFAWCRIIAAPSAMRRTLRPHCARRKQTVRGIVLPDVILFVGGREHFALVDEYHFRACNTSASAKCPMRTLAITESSRWP